MATTIIYKLNNGNVVVENASGRKSYPADMQVQMAVTSCHINDKSGSRQHVFEVVDIIKLVRKDGTEILSPDINTLFFELSTFFFFKIGSGAANHLGVFTNYTDLITQYPTAGVGDLAYCENSQGTFWLPGTLGGTFYSKGVYMYNGAFWDSSVDEIAAQLEEDSNDIYSLQTALTDHVTDLDNPHQTTLENLDDISLGTPITGDILVYNSVSGKWENNPQTISDKYFIFTQAIASTTWTISHGLNKKPSVTVVDNLGRKMRTVIAYVDDNNLTSETNSAISGKAYLN